MEQRYHPKIFKKGKNDHRDHKDHKEVNSMIDKKLNSQKNSKEKPIPASRISKVVDEKFT